jgi:methionyl-tRNA formyltransferase
MRIVFAGTPDFAAAALAALHAAGHDIALVLTQPDRPAGRGLNPSASAVKRLAGKLGLAVRQPLTLKDPQAVAELARVAPEAIVVAAYGLILPRDVLALPARGCINIHASLLPRWRGAAPIQRAILAGDAETGISIMQMDAGLDTGPVLAEEAIPIGNEDTAQTLHDRLAALGARLIVRALAERLEPRAQDDAAATYAPKIDKREAVIDWNESAETLDRRIRAFNPFPGASTTRAGTLLKIWKAVPVPGGERDIPGTVSDVDSGGITVRCGSGAVKLVELQRAGGKRLPASTFLAGFPLARGDRLGA